MFICLVLVCIPGILVITPSTIKTVERVAQKRMPADQEMPSRTVVALASALQTLVLMAIAAAVGTALVPRVGLGAPFFEALVAGEPFWPALAPQLLPALVTGIVGGLIFVAAYYLYFRPRLDAQTVRAMEDLRNALGIWGRVLYGGIAEEVLTRWGLMTLLVWLGTLLVGPSSPAVMWGAIVISGILFGLGHAPGHLAAGCQRSPTFFAAIISLNLWASLIFGWLYWQYGLLAAMMAHALLHLVWWPLDLRYYRRLVAEPAN